MTRKRREPWRARRRREHLLLAVAFLATRVALAAIGLRYNFELDWMFLCDPSDLRGRLFDCIYYFHAYPPGMNLLTGVLLKVGAEHASLLACGLFWLLGLALTSSLFYLLRVFGVGFRASFGVALGFSLIPQTLYFEHLYLYEHVVAACLALAGACLYWAVERRSGLAYFCTFALAATIGWFRSSFHLIWFVSLLGIALWFGRRAGVRRILVGAALPGLALVALYSKNAALFGVFGATSAAGGNLTHITIEQLTPEERAAWVAEHKVSPFAALGDYAPPGDYLSFFPPHVDGRSPILDALERPTFHSPNFNHWVMIPVMKTRRDDALVYLRARPLDYLTTVGRGLVQFFGPATDWHPRTGRPGSPHYQHAQVVGRYTAAYNAVVHWGWGLYVLLPFPFVWGCRRVLMNWATPIRFRQARAAVLTFALVQIAYVVVTSALFTIGESARYRQQVEALIWFLAAAWVGNWMRARRRKSSVRRLEAIAAVRSAV